jgi:16S rRNA processing protein RimM
MGDRTPEGTVCVGALAGAFGVRGEVRLKSFCADPAAIESYGPLVTEAGQSFDVALSRPIPNGFAARLSGVTTKEQADALRGVRLYARRERLPALDEDEFYHADLLGLRVLDTGGTEIGRIKAVLNHGAGDILEVATPKGVVLLPFSRAAVPTVDVAGGRVIADPPEGIFPDD